MTLMAKRDSTEAGEAALPKVPISLVAASLVVAVMAAWGMQEGLARLALRWRYDYSHGWLVLAMSGWMLVRTLRLRGSVQVEPSALGMVAAGLAVCAYALAVLLNASLVMMALLPLVFLSAVAAFAGMRLAGAFLAPVALLYLAVPIWNVGIPVLQGFAVAAVKMALTVYGPPAFVLGNLIEIPAGSFEIQGDCSGLRYLLVSLSLATFCGHLWYGSWFPRLLLLAIAGGVTFLANVLRIYSLILIGEATNMQHYLIAESHELFGWVVYFAFVGPVFWLAGRVDQARVAVAQRTPTIVFEVASPRSVGLCGLAVGLLLASPALLKSAPIEQPSAPIGLQVLPDGDSGWSRGPVSGSWSPIFVSPYFTVHEAYRKGEGKVVEVYIARYLSQGTEAKLVSMRNKLYASWQLSSKSTAQLGVAGSKYRVEEHEIVRDSETRLVWSWYVVGGYRAYNPFSAKAMEVVALLSGRRDGALLAVSSVCGVDCVGARGEMRRFLEDNGTRMEAIANGLEEASQGR